MILLLFCLGIIFIGIFLFNMRFGTSIDSLGTVGYVQCNPIYYSGNKQQKSKKHNMLRISKLRRKK